MQSSAASHSVVTETFERLNLAKRCALLSQENAELRAAIDARAAASKRVGWTAALAGAVATIAVVVVAGWLAGRHRDVLMGVVCSPWTLLAIFLPLACVALYALLQAAKTDLDDAMVEQS